MERIGARCGEKWVNVCWVGVDPAVRDAALRNVFRETVRLDGDTQYCSHVVVQLPQDLSTGLVNPSNAATCAAFSQPPGPVMSAAGGVPGMGAPSGMTGTIALDDGTSGFRLPPPAPEPGPVDPELAALLGDIPTVGGQGALVRTGPSAGVPSPEPVAGGSFVGSGATGPVGGQGMDPAFGGVAPGGSTGGAADPELAALLSDMRTSPDGAPAGAFAGTPGSAGAAGMAGAPPISGGSPVAGTAPGARAPAPRPPDAPPLELDEAFLGDFTLPAPAPPPEPLDPELAALLGDIPTVRSQGALTVGSEPAPRVPVAIQAPEDDSWMDPSPTYEGDPEAKGELAQGSGRPAADDPSWEPAAVGGPGSAVPTGSPVSTGGSGASGSAPVGSVPGTTGSTSGTSGFASGTVAAGTGSASPSGGSGSATPPAPAPVRKPGAPPGEFDLEERELGSLGRIERSEGEEEGKKGKKDEPVIEMVNGRRYMVIDIQDLPEDGKDAKPKKK